MTTSPSVDVVGAQRPRLSSYPPFRSSAGQECVELAASAGVFLDDWQAHTLHVFLGERADGKWACVECGLIVPRQNGKGEILLARELAGLFLFDERLIIHTAHEFKTAQEAFLRIKAVVDNTDDLRRKVRAIREANGEQGIELLNGARLRFLARSKGSGRGFTGDCVVLDEAYALQAAHVGAIRPTMSARPNPQMWITSSAGMPDSEVLHSIRARALAAIAAGEPSGRFGFLEHSAADGAANDDVDAIALGNPALGIRIELETVLDELRAATTPELIKEYRRERLGITEDDSVLAVIAAETWAALADIGAGLTDDTSVAFAVDVTPDRRFAAVGACGGGADGTELVDVVDYRPGVDWVVARVLELRDKHAPCAIAVDPKSPAGSLLPDFAAAGLDVVEVSTTEALQACEGFYDACTETEPRLRHLSQPSLNDAVKGALKRELSEGGWLWDRKKSTDISSLVAVSYARWAWTVHGQAPREFWGAWG